MLFLGRPSAAWRLDSVVLSDLLKTVVVPFFAARRERSGTVSLPPLSHEWLREHELESAKRGAR